MLLDEVIYEKDVKGKEEFMGREKMDVNGVVKNGKVGEWVELEGVKSGMVKLSMNWMDMR